MKTTNEKPTEHDCPTCGEHFSTCVCEETGAVLYKWIATTLVNDEAATDQEMREHLESAGPMSYQEACFYVSQRHKALRDPLHFTLERWQG